jgi:hypothetical protein
MELKLQIGIHFFHLHVNTRFPTGSSSKASEACILGGKFPDFLMHWYREKESKTFQIPLARNPKLCTPLRQKSLAEFQQGKCLVILGMCILDPLEELEEEIKQT